LERPGDLASVPWGLGCSSDPPRVRKCHQMSSKEHIQLGLVVRWVLLAPPRATPRPTAGRCVRVVPVLPLLLCTRPARVRPSIGGQSPTPAPRQLLSNARSIARHLHHLPADRGERGARSATTGSSQEHLALTWKGQGISPQFPGVLVGAPRVRKCHQMSSKEHIQLGWVVRWVLSTPPCHPTPHGWAVCTCRASTSLAPLYSPCASSAFDWGSKPHSRSAPAPVESSPGPRTHCPFHRLFIPDCLSWLTPARAAKTRLGVS
jgi:hypothetical protein